MLTTRRRSPCRRRSEQRTTGFTTAHGRLSLCKRRFHTHHTPEPWETWRVFAQEVKQKINERRPHRFAGKTAHSRRKRAERGKEIDVEQDARQHVFEVEFNSRALLGRAKRSRIVDQANFQLNMQEAKKENTVPHLTQQLRHQCMELSSRSQDCEKSRKGQLQLLTEVRNRERAHQETLIDLQKEAEAKIWLHQSQHKREREASDARASVYHSEREDSMHSPHSHAQGIRGIQFETRSVRGKDSSCTKEEGLIAKEILKSYSFANNRLSDLDKKQKQKVIDMEFLHESYA